MDPKDYDQAFADLRSAAAKNGIELGEVTIDDTAIRTRMEKQQAIAAVNVAAGVASTPGAPEGETGGVDQLWLRVGTQALRDARGALGRVGNPKYAADADILQRVVAAGVSADATSPVTIEGDIVSFIDPTRWAIVGGSRQLPLPDNHAPTFKRPRLSQRATVGQQVAENDVLSSQRFQLTGDTVTKQTRGGVLSLSEQELDWSSPAALGVALAELAKEYAIDTDNVFTDAVEAAVVEGNETICSLTAAPDVFIAAVSAAASTVYTNSRHFADVLYVAVDRWAYLSALVDGDGRPLFPITNPVNPAGTSGGAASFAMTVQGLRVVVDPNFSSNFWAVGCSQLAEWYEQPKGIVTLNAPSTLSVEYAIRGYCATYIRGEALSSLESA